MTHVCKNKCERYGTKNVHTIKVYELGMKYCDLCAMYFDTCEQFCPCCGTCLRRSAHNNHNGKKNRRFNSHTDDQEGEKRMRRRQSPIHIQQVRVNVPATSPQIARYDK